MEAPVHTVTRSVPALGVLLIVTMPALSAQHPQTREGFWIGLGGGWGDAVLSCSPNCTFTLGITFH